MKKRMVALLLCIFLLTGCTDPIPEPSAAPSQPRTETGEETTVYQMLFDIHNKLTLRLDMSDTELAKMQADYEKYDQNGSKSPIYRMADLYITITTPEGKNYDYSIPEVGVRMKGNTSRTSFYSPETGIYNLIHLKLSFQETFDDPAYYGDEAKIWTEKERQARKDRTFATLEKLDLRWNRCDDSTYLKEYFAYESYRQFGVPAPRINLASLDWAGEHMGVYTINEPVDKAFLEKNFPADALGGDLYKIGWAGNSNGSFTSTTSIGVEDEDNRDFYAYDLNTNKKTSTHESLKALIQTLNSKDLTKEGFAEAVDLDTFLPYCAVSYLLGNPDDLRNNYNNSYIYFRADTGKMVVIPYDFDRCLGVTAHWNPTGDGVTSDNPFGTSLNADGSDQRSPLFLRSVCAGGFYVLQYAEALKQISENSWWSYENFADTYALAAANYEELTTPSKSFENGKNLHFTMDLDRTSDFSSWDNISYREYMDAKVATLKHYLADVNKYLENNIPLPAVWYIRADFTNWQNDDRYAMQEENGRYSIRITAGNQVRLKVYNDQTGAWYGTECIDEDCGVAYETDDHTNIVLEKGSYIISIDPETEIITLEKE